MSSFEIGFWTIVFLLMAIIPAGVCVVALYEAMTSKWHDFKSNAIPIILGFFYTVLCLRGAFICWYLL